MKQINKNVLYSEIYFYGSTWGTQKVQDDDNKNKPDADTFSHFRALTLRWLSNTQYF